MEIASLSALEVKLIHEGWIENPIAFPVKKKKVVSLTKEIHKQELPITIDNFFVSTKGVFNELKEVPKDFTLFYKSKTSKYFTNESKNYIIRVSDHWGYQIKYCDWFLKLYQTQRPIKITSWNWQKVFGKEPRIGLIHISQFKPR